MALDSSRVTLVAVAKTAVFRKPAPSLPSGCAWHVGMRLEIFENWREIEQVVVNAESGDVEVWLEDDNSIGTVDELIEWYTSFGWTYERREVLSDVLAGSVSNAQQPAPADAS